MAILYPEEANSNSSIAESIETNKKKQVPVPLTEPPIEIEVVKPKKPKRIRPPVFERGGGVARELVTMPQQPMPSMPQEGFHQNLFAQLFGWGEKVWGWKNEPVVMEDTITSGGGLIKGTTPIFGTDERRTARMFGI